MSQGVAADGHRRLSAALFSHATATVAWGFPSGGAGTGVLSWGFDRGDLPALWRAPDSSVHPYFATVWRSPALLWVNGQLHLDVAFVPPARRAAASDVLGLVDQVEVVGTGGRTRVMACRSAVQEGLARRVAFGGERGNTSNSLSRAPCLLSTILNILVLHGGQVPSVAGRPRLSFAPPISPPALSLPAAASSAVRSGRVRDMHMLPSLERALRLVQPESRPTSPAPTLFGGGRAQHRTATRRSQSRPFARGRRPECLVVWTGTPAAVDDRNHATTVLS